MSLAIFARHIDLCIVHANVDGVRGADFKELDQNVKVIDNF